MARQSDLRFGFRVSDEFHFDVVRFDLAEALSEPFRLELDLSRDDPLEPLKTASTGESDGAEGRFGLESLLDRSAVFVIERAGEATRTLRGIVTAIELCEAGFRKTRYRAVVEPEVVRLGLWHGSRIHQQISVPQIVNARLKERGLHARLATSRDHLVREYAVQHRETDLAFLSRLGSEEGFVYYFDAAAQSQLTFTDFIPAGPSLPGHGDIGAVTYQPTPGGDCHEPRLWHFGVRQQLSVAQVTQRDHTFKNPGYSLEHRSVSSNPLGQYEHYDFPGRYKVDAAGKPFTATRLQSLRNKATVANLAGDDARLWPGLSFLLADHPTPEMNRDWRIVSMRHSGTQAVSQEADGSTADEGTHYAYTATAVPGDLDWKPLAPRRPVMDGPQVAQVVGPPNEPIHVDEHGRVMVWFPWDREGPKENSSCWIRVCQGWAGAAYGALFTPRVGHNVLVSFVDGDPDQPLLTGRAYDAANRPPYPLPAHKTISTIKSDEHKGAGHNELLIDDTSGELKTQLKSTHAATQITAGFLTGPRDRDGRGEPRGEGFEVRTDANGALRASALLLTAYTRRQASGGQLDASELVGLLDVLTQTVTALADTAAQHRAPPMDHKARDALVASVDKLGAGANDRPKDTGAKSIVAITAPDGVVAATPQSVLLGAGANIDVVAERDASVTSGGQVHVTAGAGVAQFALDGGITQIAHRDDVRTQAQHGNIVAEAAQTIRHEAAQQLLQSAGEKMVLTCGKSGLAFNPDGRVEVFGTELILHGAFKRLNPQSAQSAMPRFDDIQTNGRFRLVGPDGVQCVPNRLYRMTLDDGQSIEGRSDGQGFTELLTRNALRIAHLEVFDDE